MNSHDIFNSKQRAFQELFIGSLIYATVLGLFADYTPFVEVRSFSTVLYASIVLEVLTFLTFRLKKRAVAWLKPKAGTTSRVITFFCVWLIMFLSKFVFIGALDMLFGYYISIHGFFGILLVVISVTVIHRLAYLIFYKLGDTQTPA